MPNKPRKTIGINPLDAVVPDLRGAPQTSGRDNQARQTPSTEVAQNRGSERKERLTIHLTVELIDRLKNAVFWTPGLTLAELGEHALSRYVGELEAERGAAFEARLSDLKGGRPLKK